MFISMIVCVIQSVSVFAYDFKVDGLCFNVLSESDHTVELTYEAINSPYVGDVVIPKTVHNNGISYRVIRIGDFSMVNMSKISGYSYWWESNTQLKSVNIQAEIESIGQQAFANCTSLSTLVLPESLQQLGFAAFRHCSSLRYIMIPKNVSSIADAVFSYCTSLSSIFVDNSNVNYCEINGVLFTKDKKKLVSYPAGGDTSYIIPNTVAEIQTYAFEGCSMIESISLPSSINVINQGAFWNCNSLKDINIPVNVQAIGDQVFNYCHSLSRITSELFAPVNINENCFPENAYSNAILYVPYSRKDIYATTSPWSVFKNIVELSPRQFSLSITSIGNGYVDYSGTNISITTRSFNVNEASSHTLCFIPNNGYRVGKLLVNNVDKTANIVDNQYTINNISQNTTVNVTFEAIPNPVYTLTINTNSLGRVDFFYTTNPEPGTDHAEYRGTVTSVYTRDVVKGGGLTLTFYPNSGCELSDFKVNGIDVKSDVKESKYSIGRITEDISISVVFLEVESKQQINGHDYVDLGLSSGKLWATMNYGASKVEDYGNYVIWSATDIVSSSWGKEWITPSRADIIELEHNCTWIWEQKNGVNGYTIKGKNGNTIFIPAAGVKMGDVMRAGEWLYYWTSTRDADYSDMVNIIMATSSSVAWGSLNSAISQIPIRPVTKDGNTLIPTAYTLSITSLGNGHVTYSSNYVSGTTKTYTINEGASATLMFTPNSGHRVGKLLVNNVDKTSSIVNNQYTINNISQNTTVNVTFEAIPTTTYTLSITSSGNGSVKFSDTTISSTTKTFTLNKGATATLVFTPNNGCRVKSLTVNSIDKTSNINDNQYAISSISQNISVSITFEEIPTGSSLSFDGVNYTVTSWQNRTVKVSNGQYGKSLKIPASFSATGVTWNVIGIDKSVIKNNLELAAVIWNPQVLFDVTVDNPNFLLYVSSAEYAPSSIKNVIVNGTASSIVLRDNASNGSFYCPLSFFAKKITYWHTYMMTTGVDECRGWETLALPFDVQNVISLRKGDITPFASSDGNKYKFWLYELTNAGWKGTSAIKANTPYIISMPNNDIYLDEYRLNGFVTFAASDVTIKKTEINSVNYGNRVFYPNFSMKERNNELYALNVRNAIIDIDNGEKEGSMFVKNLRKIYPFEAYMTDINGTRASFGIFEDIKRDDCELIVQRIGKYRSGVYNLNGQKIEIEADGKLPAGIYIINGHKRIVK